MTMVLDQGLPGDDEHAHGEFKAAYLQMLRHLERLHRLLLDVIRDEFERDGTWDISAVQALLIYNIGDNKLTAGELRGRGFYLGSNVSYNLKKLIAGGYIEQNRSARDRRSIHIRLTAMGKGVCESIDELYDRQLQAVETVGDLAFCDFSNMNQTMLRLERFWHDQIRFKL